MRSPDMGIGVPKEKAPENETTAPEQKQHNLDQEKAIVSTLINKRGTLESILEATKTRRYKGRDNITDAELSLAIGKEMGFTPELLDYLNDKQRESLKSAARLIESARLTMREQETYFKSSDPTPEEMQKLQIRMETQDKLDAARAIIDLVWELQPRKTYADFEANLDVNNQRLEQVRQSLGLPSQEKSS